MCAKWEMANSSTLTGKFTFERDEIKWAILVC